VKPADILGLIAQGEGETLELKKSTAEALDGMRGLCAMANHRGGILLFGVSPDVSKPVEARMIGQMVSDGTLRDLGNELRKFEPPLACDLERVRLSTGRDVLVLSVPGGGGPFVIVLRLPVLARFRSVSRQWILSAPILRVLGTLWSRRSSTCAD
jgi:predicted HTH transcriptional regulator